MTLAVGAIVFDAAGRVLLIQRGKPPAEGLWSFPGGRVEAGETLEQAVVREVREETGLEIEVGPLVVIVERPPYEIHDFVARVVGGVLAAGDDARDARFVEEPTALPCTEGLPAVIEQARATHAAWCASR
jgi:ADP-ribose pyrophosphatase YjhB (NUDIX family)